LAIQPVKDAKRRLLWYSQLVKIFIYTFKSVSNPEIFGADVFVLQKLKNDLNRFIELIEIHKPDTILGIGNAQFTAYESLAINRFHGRTLIRDGDNTYDLYIPSTSLRVNNKPTESFCNWTAYRIARFIIQKSLNTKLSFLHLEPNQHRIVAEEIKRAY
jgi:hypothetical protein